MSRADDLFQRLEAGGLQALNEILADLEPESLFLDFKRANGDGAGPRLEDSDNKNLAKGISGFANSEGGLLIWGIDCRRDAAGNEIATKHAVVDAAGFRTRLEAAISRETIPPHPGVRMLDIQETPAAPAGYVVVLVPKSDIGPLRSTKSHHYHMRTGSDFAIVSHDVLAGMFGRSPQPRIFANFLSHPARISERQDSVALAFGIVVVNLGAVLASRPYLSVWHGDLAADRITATASQPDLYPIRRGLLPGFSFVGHDGGELPPGGVDQLCDIVIAVPPTYGRTIQLTCAIGARNAAPQRFTITILSESLATIPARANNGGLLRSSDFMVFNPSITDLTA